MSELDAELAGIFRDETVGRLDEMDTDLLVIESGDAGAESVDSLFRHAHTIKGAAGIVGFDDIRLLARAVEEVLAGVRDRGVFPPELAAQLLRATAALRARVTGTGEAAEGDLIDDLAAGLATLSDGGAAAPEPGRASAGTEPGPPSAGPEPGPASAGTESGPASAGPAPGRASAGREPGPASAGSEPGPASAGSEPGPASAGREPRPPSSEPGQLPAGIPEPRPAAAEVPAVSPAGPERGAQVQEARGPEAARRPLRVPAEKIDHLLDIVGELMLYRSELAHALGQEQRLPQHTVDVLTSGERMLAELKDSAIGIRTLPLAVLAGRLPRVVRDMARTAGKDVEFVVTGADTELDRVIIESLYEPLTHVLRNSVMHGIEAPEERERAGKPARGRLELRAVLRGNLVEVVVADDGRGPSPDVIEEARREGSLTDVLTQPGYSTAAEVTDLAGRGVGLDAVKSYAQALGGSLEIRGEPGRGLDVVLMLPLALALVEVLLCERGEAVYGVPLVVVEEIITVTRTLMLEGRPAVEVRGRPVPVADIAALAGAAASPLGDRPPAVVVSASGRRIVATCDSVLGAEEVVIKTLGSLCRGTGSYLGTGILGDGRIALLLEPAALTGALARHAPAPPATHESGPAGSAGPAKILVVEDSFTVRELQRSILETAGYPVVTVRDGREALAALARNREIALVVTDLDMPELDGLSLTRAIRADQLRSSLPVIIVTSHGTEKDRQRGIEAGADAYMAKRGFDQQALLATVERLVGR